MASHVPGGIAGLLRFHSNGLAHSLVIRIAEEMVPSEIKKYQSIRHVICGLKRALERLRVRDLKTEQKRPDGSLPRT